MRKRKLSKAGKLIVTTIFVCMGCSAIRFGSLQASSEHTGEYGESEQLIIDQVRNIHTMKVIKQDQVSIACTYPSDEEGICAGIALKASKLYRNANLPPGEMSETGFLPYRYEIEYENTSGEIETLTLSVKRKEGSSITAFPEASLIIGTQELSITGEAPSYTFTSDDPKHLQFDGNKATVTAGGKQEAMITAHDPGTAYVSGQDVTASFLISEAQAQTNEAIIAEVTPAALPLKANTRASTMSLEPDVWYGNSSTLQVTISLENKEDMFTYDSFLDIDIPPTDEHGNSWIRLEAQIVNLMDDPSLRNETRESIKSWSQEKINTVFAGKAWTVHDAIDTSKEYSDPSTKTWIQALSIDLPDTDGIYMVRYRLHDTYSNNLISLIVNGETFPKETGVFDQRVVGLDYTAPVITIKAKRQNETSYHVLQDDEMLGNFAQLKISADGDIAGLNEVKFQFVKRGERVTEVWTPLSTDGIVPVPENFDGSIIVYASDQVSYANYDRYTKVEKSIKASASTGMKITLPQANIAWQNISDAIISIEEPADYSVSYDGILMTFLTQGKVVIDPIFIEKNDFVNGRKTIPLDNGSYTLKASVVRKQGDGYIVADDAATKTTELKVDHTAEIKAVAGDKTAYGYEIELTPTTGPSKIKEVKRTFTNDGGTVYTTLLTSKNGEYTDLAELNGTYTYTLTNNAGKTATAQPIKIVDLTSTAPVLDITGKDETGKAVHSGEKVSEYVKVKAENINPDADPSIKIEVCKRSQGVMTDCKPYTIGEELTISESGEIIFQDPADPAHSFGTFEVVIGNSINLGTITIQNESSYTKDHWHGNAQTINATLSDQDEGVVLQSKINDGTWNDVTGTTASIPLSTSGSYLVSFRSKKGSEASSSKQVQVNIDLEQPQLTLNKSGTSDTKAIIDFTVQVGKSGLKQAKVSADGMTLNLDGWIQGNTVKPYTITKNGTYTFTITNGAGKTASASITITALDESKIQLQQILIQNQMESPYDGTWKNGTVRLEIDGGDKETQKLDHYEKSSDGVTWTKCDDTLLFQEEGEHHIAIRAVDQAGALIDQSDTIIIRIDRTPPQVPLITFTDLHDDALSHFLRSITFDQILNKAQQATMTSADTFSNVTIYYQRAKNDGDYEKDLTASAWKRYEEALSFEEEGSVKLYAYAVDEAGNPSDVIDSDQLLYDFSAPMLYGIAQDEASGYIPRMITYEDVLSGMDEEASSLTFNKKNLPLTQSMLIKEPGDYEFHLIDLANNERIQSFTLKSMPNPDDITGSDEDGELIDEIKKEYEENKDQLDEETRKEIEDMIKELEEAFAKQRITHLEDEASGATLDGEAGTSFAKNTVLSVTRITEQLSEEERRTYAEMLELSETELNDIYEVKLMQDDKEVELKGKATLRIPYEQVIHEFVLVKPELRTIAFTQEEQLLKATIDMTGHYVMSKESIQNIQDPQDTLVNGAYQPSILTGDITKLTFTSCLFTGSTLILLMSAIIYKRKRSKHYE